MDQEGLGLPMGPFGGLWGFKALEALSPPWGPLMATFISILLRKPYKYVPLGALVGSLGESARGAHFAPKCPPHEVPKRDPKPTEGGGQGAPRGAPKGTRGAP